MSGRNFQFSAGAERWDEVRAALGQAYQIQEAAATSSSICFYDTFEWGVWFAGCVLWEENNVLRLSERQDGWMGDEKAALALDEPVPSSANDLPDSPLAKILRALCGLRALRSVGEFHLRHHPVKLLDAEYKTIMRLDRQEISPTLFLCRAKPLRGYEAKAAAALALLEDLADREPICSLSWQGKPPRPYTLRPAFDLTDDLPAREAVRHIIQKILQIARENEPGIIDDIDTEFLHDQRICVRKIRSVLSLLQGVYPDRETGGLKKTFSRWGGMTNRLRDLDVQILARSDYARQLPKALQPGLEEIFADFARERAAEQGKVADIFRAAAFQREAKAIERFFAGPDQLPPSETSAQPIKLLISAQIYRRYRKIRKIGRTLRDDTPDKVIHEVRVHGKKLRYLMEFFSELFSAEELRPLEKRLRVLQNRLGRFNDLSVQQKSLLSYWRQKETEGRPPAAAALALGGLVAVLYRAHEKERARVHREIAGFISDEVAALFSATFEPVEKSEEADS